MMFSIVIPLYNKAHTILSTLSTVLNQTFKDFETFSGLNSTFADSSKTPAYMKKTKEFIEKLDKNKNYIFVAHHTTIQGLVDKFANSGEMIIVDRSYKFLVSFKVN